MLSQFEFYKVHLNKRICYFTINVNKSIEHQNNRTGTKLLSDILEPNILVYSSPTNQPDHFQLKNNISNQINHGKKKLLVVQNSSLYRYLKTSSSQKNP